MKGVWTSLMPIMLAVGVGVVGGTSLWGLWSTVRGRLPLRSAIPAAIAGLGVFGVYVWLGLQLQHPWLVAIACVSVLAGLFYDWGSRPPPGHTIDPRGPKTK